MLFLSLWLTLFFIGGHFVHWVIIQHRIRYYYGTLISNPIWNSQTLDVFQALESNTAVYTVRSIHSTFSIYWMCSVCIRLCNQLPHRVSAGFVYIFEITFFNGLERGGKFVDGFRWLVYLFVAEGKEFNQSFILHCLFIVKR